MKSVGKMGKYIKKSKLDGGESLSLIDVSPSPLGVLTRAKSLALQRRLQKPSPSPSSSSPSKQKTTTDCGGGGGGGGSYLQLRSRRLQKKPPIVVIRRRKKQRRVRNPNSQNQDSGRGSGDGSRSDSVAESAVCGKANDFNGEINLDELHGSERTTRESTPCSLMRKPETVTSPGSSPKLNNVVSDDSNEREESLSGSRGHLPTTPEMDEFFSGAEEEQQKQFIDKYNFDPVNEQPLPGRFEWKKIDD
ncbi:cyclin-dependent kinase inhibitor 4-like isoform X2 [Raphanus sativus]|uniref:Cyclin-dependent kinase inhibitor 4-like isoform X2 n=1 Tax=Raphanus sativus TaxID=3726 RepID=A0A6J0LY19_RAPSA|nr:cyclin-dependent kinase inhibitor 4-like isoform X2 [Raphanus sativus]